MLLTVACITTSSKFNSQKDHEDQVFLYENILHFVLKCTEYHKYVRFLIAACAHDPLPEKRQQIVKLVYTCFGVTHQRFVKHLRILLNGILVITKPSFK